MPNRFLQESDVETHTGPAWGSVSDLTHTVSPLLQLLISTHFLRDDVPVLASNYVLSKMCYSTLATFCQWPSFSCSNEVLVDVTRLKVATFSFLIKQYCSYFWLDTALNTAHYFFFHFSLITNLCCFHFVCTSRLFLHMSVHLDKHILCTFHSIFLGYLLWNYRTLSQNTYSHISG